MIPPLLISHCPTYEVPKNHNESSSSFFLGCNYLRTAVKAQVPKKVSKIYSYNVYQVHSVGYTNLKFLTPSLSIYVDYSHAAAISVPHCCHCTAATHVMAALALLAITMVRGCWRSPHYIDIPTVAVQMPSLMSRPQMSSRWHSKHPSRTPCT